MTNRQRSSNAPRPGMLAGWLFADLCLVLFVIALASLPPAPQRLSHQSQLNPRVVRSRVLERVPVSLSVAIPPTAVQNPVTRAQALGHILSDLQRELLARSLQGRRAGFVLIFGSGPVTGITAAQAAAQSVLRFIEKRDAVFGQTSGQGYWMGSGNGFSFKVFFFAKPNGA